MSKIFLHAEKNGNFAPDGRTRDRRKRSHYGKRVLHREGRRVKVLIH